jgi:hypothetical protein
MRRLNDLKSAICCAFLTTAVLMAASHATAGTGIALAPHRAIYEMSLDKTRSGSSVTAVKGRMVYELTGSACDGYTQNMRFVTQMSSAEGPTVLSDLRSSTWEDADARIFRFNSTQLRNEKATETTVGDANRAGPGGEIKVEITRPAKATKTLKAGTYYPVQHSIALVAAAKAGRDRLRVDIYDGSEKGEKVYDTSARIGKRVAPGANRKLPPIENAAPLDALPAWPVTISYFELGQDARDAVPVYELGFLYFENGVSRKLLIDYGDFAIKGELSALTFLDAGKCEAK